MMQYYMKKARHRSLYVGESQLGKKNFFLSEVAMTREKRTRQHMRMLTLLFQGH